MVRVGQVFAVNWRNLDHGLAVSQKVPSLLRVAGLQECIKPALSFHTIRFMHFGFKPLLITATCGNSPFSKLSLFISFHNLGGKGVEFLSLFLVEKGHSFAAMAFHEF